jgi:hypothetical protein
MIKRLARYVLREELRRTNHELTAARRDIVCLYCALKLRSSRAALPYQDAYDRAIHHLKENP